MQLKSNVFWLVAFGLSGADTPSYPARGRGGKGDKKHCYSKVKIA